MRTGARGSAHTEDRASVSPSRQKLPLSGHVERALTMLVPKAEVTVKVVRPRSDQIILRVSWERSLSSLIATSSETAIKAGRVAAKK